MAFADAERDAINALTSSEARLGAKAAGDTMDLNSWIWSSTNARMCYRGFNSRSPRCCDTHSLTSGKSEWGAGFDVKNPGDSLPVVCEYRCKRSTAPRSVAVRTGGIDRILEDQKDDPESWFSRVGQFLEAGGGVCPEDHDHDIHE